MQQSVVTEQEVPAPAAVALRPFGYLLVTVTWLAIFAIAFGADFCLFVVPPGPLSARSGFHNLDVKNTIAMWACVLFMLPFAWGLVHQLMVLTFSNLLLSVLALGRSLRPSYRREKLTCSQLRDDTIGPPGTGNVSLSLLPVRQTRFSRRVTHLNIRSWVLNGTWYLGMACFGYVTIALIYLVHWPVRNPFGMTGLVLFALAFAVLGARRLRVGWNRAAEPASD